MDKFKEFEKSLLPFLRQYTQRYIWETIRTESEVKEVLNAISKSPGEHGVSPENFEEFKRAIKDVTDFKFSNGFSMFSEPKHYTWGKIEFPAHTPYDSLAHAISLTRAPIGATRENFYYPVAANVSRMFNILGGKNSPTRTCIIFDELGKASNNSALTPMVISTADYVLGGTIPWTDSTKTKTRIQEERCKWMHEITKNPRFADPKTSDLNNKGLAKSGQLFGHCAETYAYILKLYNMDPSKRKTLAGFSLKADKINRIKSLEDLFSARAREKYVQNPCLNCMNQILKYYKADPVQFEAEAKEYFKFP